MEVQAYSIEQAQIDIIKRVAAEHKSNNSAALRFIIEYYNVKQIAFKRHMAQLQATLVKDPNGASGLDGAVWAAVGGDGEQETE